MNKKVILITGASSGIGYSTAKLLLEEGHIVYCTARRVENMRELKRLGGKVIFLDVRDERAVQKVINTIIRMESRIDAVFANSLKGVFSISHIANIVTYCVYVKLYFDNTGWYIFITSLDKAYNEKHSWLSSFNLSFSVIIITLSLILLNLIDVNWL